MLGIVFWLLVSVAVLGYLGISLNTLMVQRAAWKLFADKYKLGFEKEKGIYGRVFISGAINGRRLNLYHMNDVREFAYMRENYVHVEVFLNNIPPALMLFSAKALPDFAHDFGLPEQLVFKDGVMPKTLQVAQSDDAGKAMEWLGEGKRIQALSAFLQMGGERDTPMFMADGENAFLLWRTQDDMRDAHTVNALVQKLFGYAKDLDGV